MDIFKVPEEKSIEDNQVINKDIIPSGETKKIEIEIKEDNKNNFDNTKKINI